MCKSNPGAFPDSCHQVRRGLCDAHKNHCWRVRKWRPRTAGSEPCGQRGRRWGRALCSLLTKARRWGPNYTLGTFLVTFKPSWYSEDRGRPCLTGASYSTLWVPFSPGSLAAEGATATRAPPLQGLRCPAHGASCLKGFPPDQAGKRAGRTQRGS